LALLCSSLSADHAAFGFRALVFGAPGGVSGGTLAAAMKGGTLP
jgi:hypothetical protein